MLDLVIVACSIIRFALFLLLSWNVIFLPTLTKIKFLQIIRLARKLPTGDVSALKTDAAEEHGEPLDENDLT